MALGYRYRKGTKYALTKRRRAAAKRLGRCARRCKGKKAGAFNSCRRTCLRKKR